MITKEMIQSIIDFTGIEYYSKFTKKEWSLFVKKLWSLYHAR